VVVQNGRLFQQHYPEVPVLHDRGRFLLVKLDPAAARNISVETCYGVIPLEGDQVVFAERAAVATLATVPFIQELVNRATRTSLEPNLKALVAFGTRHSTTTGFTKAAAFAEMQIKDLGYHTATQAIKVNGKDSLNIIADKRSRGSGKRNVVIACAHLDSINLKGGVSASAPGADDDGSGSAGVLEIAAAFRDHEAAHDLRLILFGGEEEGLFGSKTYVASLSAAERARIRMVVNMDMIGSLNSASRSVLLEGAPLSQSVIDKLSDAAQTYTSLTVQTSLNPFASDHVPFINATVPAVLTIEGADNANKNIHSEKDTIDTIDYELALEILRMNIGCIAAEVGKA
jgi:Zn-dependent M28 family amino/carboxypeptidase